MTEEFAIEGGRLKVAKGERKDDIDVDLSNVETVHYERGVMNGPGALVIRQPDTAEVVIRVDEADAPDVYAAVIEAIPAKMEPSEESTVDANTEKADEQAPGAPAPATRKSETKRDGKR